MSLHVSEHEVGQFQKVADVPTLTERSRDGYPSLAGLMQSCPDYAIFRRFGELNVLHLLHLQSELQDMENELQKIREEDTESNDPIRMVYAKDFRAMRDHEEVGDSEQYEMIVKIGVKLKEYSMLSSLFREQVL
jgi:hypothetical protein